MFTVSKIWNIGYETLSLHAAWSDLESATVSADLLANNGNGPEYIIIERWDCGIVVEEWTYDLLPGNEYLRRHQNVIGW